MEENQEKAEVSKNRVYEFAVLLVPTITEENVPGKFGDIKNLLTEKGAQFVAEEMPKDITLMYEMSRTITNKKTWFERAYFGWVKFEADPSVLASFEEIIKRDEQILRYMILSTVRESTIASKKPFSREGFVKRRPVEKVMGETPVVAEEAPMTSEEIDIEIDALVDEKV